MDGAEARDPHPALLALISPPSTTPAYCLRRLQAAALALPCPAPRALQSQRAAQRKARGFAKIHRSTYSRLATSPPAAAAV